MMAPAPPVEEGKLLADALSTVKIQVVQMKRHLVSHHYLHVLRSRINTDDVGR